MGAGIKFIAISCYCEQSEQQGSAQRAGSYIHLTMGAGIKFYY